MVHATSVSLDDMRGKLLTFDQARTTLKATEPLTEFMSTVDSKNTVTLGAGWHDNPDVNAEADAWFTAAGGQRYQLTQQAALELGAIPGIHREYGKKLPASLLEDQLNWWYRGGLGNRDIKFLAKTREDKDPLALAVCRGSITPFSNVSLIDAIKEGVESKYGPGEILVDYKFNHSLERTNVRLIVPGERRNIGGTSVADDTWCTGIEFDNSLIGLKQTKVNGYVFRWWCTNGCTDLLASSGGLARRSVASPEEAYEWARAQVDAVLGGLEATLDAIQELTNIPVGDDVTMVLTDLFEQYRIPVRERNRVIAYMADTQTHTMYDLMQAITLAANGSDLDPNAIRQLLEMGGHTAHAAMGRCNSCRRLLPEGYEAPAALVAAGNVIAGEVIS